jgi:hypothetical protein
MILPAAAGNFSQRDFFLGFEFEDFAELDRRLIKPRWPNIRSRDLAAIPAAPFAIRRNWGLLPLIEDEMERVVAGAYHRGEGLIGLSLLRDSYRWILEGNAKYHAAYYEKNNWRSWQAAQKINATQRQVVRQAHLPAGKPQSVAPQARPISLFWFFAVFVLSAAYSSWFERKISP